MKKFTCIYRGGLRRGPRNLAFTQVFSQITLINCLKFMFTPSLSNPARCQTDHSRNNAIFLIQFPFSRIRICRITPSRFPLGEPSDMKSVENRDLLPLLERTRLGWVSWCGIYPTLNPGIFD